MFKQPVPLTLRVQAANKRLCQTVFRQSTSLTRTMATSFRSDSVRCLYFALCHDGVADVKDGPRFITQPATTARSASPSRDIPSNETIEQVIQQATANARAANGGRSPVIGRDTRTQLFVGNVRRPLSTSNRAVIDDYFFFLAAVQSSMARPQGSLPKSWRHRAPSRCLSRPR